MLLTAFNYSALFREADNEVLPAAMERHMGIVLGSIFHQGAWADAMTTWCGKNRPGCRQVPANSNSSPFIACSMI